MLIAKITNPVPIDYREVFQNTSFPSSGPSDEFLAEQGYAKVSVFKDHDQATQKLISAEPHYEAPWVYTVQVVKKDQADIDAETASKADQIRFERNSKLSECDWTQLADSTADKAAWAIYRQALRDITLQAGFPWEIEWPKQP